MNKSVIAVLIAIVLITVASFGGYTYVQGFVYHEYNTRNYQVETSVNGDETTLIFTLDKNEAFVDTKYKKQTTLPSDFGENLYGEITIRPEATKNDDGSLALDENGNPQYTDWGRLGASSDNNSEISFSEAMALIREGKSTNSVKTTYSYTDNGDTVKFTVTVTGYEFKDGDNIHINVKNDKIIAGGIKINDNSLALTNVEYNNGQFSEVENMFVNSHIDG
ncbi:MAG: hypothetical protein K2G60_01960 [Oscillospiraceae bacterium]|nr:hypothetical protein [Oscillospiraceae bacterium]